MTQTRYRRYVSPKWRLQQAADRLRRRAKPHHLTLEQLRFAVFQDVCDDFDDWTTVDRNLVRLHLKRCRLCAKLVAEEKAENPLYRDALGTPPEERAAYWERVSQILAEIRAGELDSPDE
jgi:hypothetical protein